MNITTMKALRNDLEALLRTYDNVGAIWPAGPILTVRLTNSDNKRSITIRLTEIMHEKISPKAPAARSTRRTDVVREHIHAPTEK